MNRRDPDLEALLARLSDQTPSGDQIRRWKVAVGRASLRRRVQPAPVAVALILGFLLGLGAFRLGRSAPEREPAGNFDPTATVEVIYDKSR